MTETGRLPDWIMIGAMKSATSSMHRYLAEHPQVATSTPKELDFFVEPKYSELGVDWYRQQFNDPSDAVVAGESSVNYTKCHQFPGVAERMHRLVPDVKLIYILRDPLQRIESQWIHAVGAGKWRGDFSSALADPDTSPMVQTSCYWTQLEQYLQYFDASQIKIMSYEDVSAEPLRSVNEFLEFVGLEPNFDHPLIGKRIHDSSLKMRPNRLGLLLWEDRKRRRRLRKYLPWLVAKPIEKPVWSTEDRNRIAAYLQPEVDKIRDFSGLRFEQWPI
ncbi:MAG: sulfotransferase [Actinomycetota bacterium]